MCEWWLFCHQKSCLAPEFLFVSRRLGSVLERWSLWAACQWVGKWWRWAGDGGRFLPQNLRWLVVEVTNPRSPRGGVWILWILGSNPKRKSFFFRSRIEHFRTTPGLVEKTGERPGNEDFSKNKTNSHIRTKPARRVEIHLKTVSLGKLVGWYFVKSLICQPFTRHHFGYPGKKYNNYRTCNFSDLNLTFV